VRGLRRLEPWLDQGHGYERILKQVGAAYPVYADELAKAVTETVRVKTAEREAVMLESCRAQAATFVSYVRIPRDGDQRSEVMAIGIPK
jgi:hypothetical protein